MMNKPVLLFGLDDKEKKTIEAQNKTTANFSGIVDPIYNKVKRAYELTNPEAWKSGYKGLERSIGEDLQGRIAEKVVKDQREEELASMSPEDREKFLQREKIANMVSDEAGQYEGALKPPTKPVANQKLLNSTDEHFPELGSVIGRTDLQNQIASEKLKGVKNMVGQFAPEIQRLKNNGMTYEQAVEKVKQESKSPEEARIAIGEINKIYGPQKTPQKFGPVDNTPPVTQPGSGSGSPTGENPADGFDKSKFDPNKISQGAIQTVSDNLSAKHMTYDNWYEDNAFRMSLIRFGLGLMSGEDYATAFSNAAGDYDNMYQKGQRGSYVDELVSDGYDKTSIMEWVQSGDSSVLTKPKKQETWVDFTDRYGVGQQSTLTGRKDYVAQVGEDYGFDTSGNLVARSKSEEGGGKGLFTYSGNMQYGVGAQMMSPSLAVWRENNAHKVANGQYGMMGKEDQDKLDQFIKRVQNTLDPAGLAATIGLTNEQYQNLVDEKRFIEAYGRILSGGAIKEEEWKAWGNVFFPRPEDASHPERIRQKLFMQDYVSMAMENIRGQYTNREIMEAMGTDDPEMAQKMLFNQAIQQASGFARQIDGFDPNTGVYHLKNGNNYHPTVGEYKVVDGKVQRISR